MRGRQAHECMEQQQRRTKTFPQETAETDVASARRPGKAKNRSEICRPGGFMCFGVEGEISIFHLGRQFVGLLAHRNRPKKLLEHVGKSFLLLPLRRAI